MGLRNHDDETGKAFRAFVDTADEVVECWSQTGDADYLLKIMVKDLGELASLIERLITAVGGFASLRFAPLSLLKAIKRTTAGAHPRVMPPLGSCVIADLEHDALDVPGMLPRACRCLRRMPHARPRKIGANFRFIFI